MRPRIKCEIPFGSCGEPIGSNIWSNIKRMFESNKSVLKQAYESFSKLNRLDEQNLCGWTSELYDENDENGIVIIKDESGKTRFVISRDNYESIVENNEK